MGIRIDPETFANEWYLDSISVDSHFRGKGFGSQLIEALPMLAKRSDERILGLSVAQTNPHAKKLYQRLGFKVVGETIISGHLYEHMQKSIG